MTLFKELFNIACGATLSLTVSADEKAGLMTINVIPKPKADAKEDALSAPLTLTATPEEFDAGFIPALAGFRQARKSLEEQAQATQDLLDAAKAASAKKGTTAVAKASAKPPQPVKRAGAKTAVEADEDTASDDTDAGDVTGGTASQAGEPSTDGDLSLFG